MLRGFLGVNWFSEIETAQNLMCPLFWTYLSLKLGVKSITLHYKLNINIFKDNNESLVA